jgi:type I restriction enzyme S subunit
MSGDEKQPLVPRLRFREFQDVGKWVEKRLGDIGNIRMCKRIFKEQTSPNGDIPFYKIGTFGGDPDVFISREIFENYRSNYPFPKKGSVLISAAGTIGRTIVYRGELAYFQDSNIVWLDNDEGLIANSFLFYLYQLINWVPSVGAIQRLYNENILGSQVKFPSIPEQQKIADCLSSLDNLIAAETRKLDTLKTHKKGLMQQLFPREGETVPRLRFPEFREAGEWKMKSLAMVCDVLQGYGFPDAMQGKTEGKYPFCKVSDISRAVAEDGGSLGNAANYINDDDLSKLRAKLIPIGATVFAKIGEALRLNRRAFVQHECLIDNNAVGLKAIRDVGNDFFIYFLSQLIDLNEHCGGTVPSVNKSTLEAIGVVIPEVDEQERIAASLSSLDDLIAAETQKLGALKTHKKGLMQQLFPAREEART